MDIKCTTDNIFHNIVYAPDKMKVPMFCGMQRRALASMEKSADSFVRRPDTVTTVTGLQGFARKVHENLKKYLRNYKQNVKHTYEHKVIFAIVERELFGKLSIDSLTHDLDKMCLYALGLPKSFVSDFHRKHSEHHIESGKKMNLRSMVCDNVASSPEFKPEKKLKLRDYYAQNDEFHQIDGLESILEKLNYGEDLNFSKINDEKTACSKNIFSVTKTILKIMAVVLIN